MQFNDAVRNAQTQATEDTVGTAPTMEIRSGAAPANCAAADTGTLLVTLTLPANWLANAVGGSQAIAGSWTTASATASGTAGHYRIKNGGTCFIQGGCAAVQTTPPADPVLVVPAAVVAGQPFTVATGALTARGA